MATQGVAGAGVNSPRQKIDDLLHMLDISPAASLEILYIDAREVVGLLSPMQASYEREYGKVLAMLMEGCE